MDWVNSYDNFTGQDLEIAELIQQRRLQMLVHSAIYYDFDFNVASDKQWDAWAKELVQLQYDHPEISERVMWHEAFKDWDASTGAFLPLKDPWVVKKASQISGKKVKSAVENKRKNNNIDAYLARKKVKK